jgi:hypothetical protein
MPSPPPTTAAAFTVHVNGERFDYDRSSVPSVSTTLAAFLRRGPPLLTGTKVEVNKYFFAVVCSMAIGEYLCRHARHHTVT